MVLEAIAKAAYIAKEVSVEAKDINLSAVISDANSIATEAWAEFNDNTVPVEIEAASKAEAIAEDAWDSVSPTEEIDGKGTLEHPRYIITKNETLANDVHPITGVEFVKKTVQLVDEVIEGVFPKFDFKYETILPDNLLLESDKNQFKECNRQLALEIERDPDLMAQFTDDQLQQITDGIEDGTAPDGYVWHHNEELGRMQLVDAEVHARTGHHGGKSIWGGGKEYR